MEIILFIVAILPTILLLRFVYKNDRVGKEPKGLLAKIFFFGVLTVIPAIILELIVADILANFDISDTSENLIALFIYVFLGVGIIEEGVKWCSLKMFTWNDKEFDHIYDAIVYSVFTSLGFATIENILYVFQNGLGTGIMRAVLSVPGHAFFGVYMGYYYGFAKHYSIYGAKELSKKNLWLSLLIPTLLHTLFDFCLFSSNTILFILYFGLVIFLYITAIKKIKTVANVKTNFIPATTPVQQQVMYNQPVVPTQTVQQPTQQVVYNQPVVPTQAVEQQVQSVPVQPVQQVQPQVQQPAATPRFCTNCGTPITGKFCTKCGKQIM